MRIPGLRCGDPGFATLNPGYGAFDYLRGSACTGAHMLTTSGP